jgi:hypothetical protein
MGWPKMGLVDMDSEERPAQPDDVGLDITLQNIVDSVEDDLLVIDGGYRIRFAQAGSIVC